MAAQQPSLDSAGSERRYNDSFGAQVLNLFFNLIFMPNWHLDTQSLSLYNFIHILTSLPPFSTRTPTQYEFESHINTFECLESRFMLLKKNSLEK